MKRETTVTGRLLLHKKRIDGAIQHVVLFMALALMPTGNYAAAQLPVPTTLEDFFQPGSQPSSTVVYDSFRSNSSCRLCHESLGEAQLVIQAPLEGSMMGQAARDPMFFACLAIANQDAAFAGDVCLRCHTPGGWISGRSEPPDGSALTALDRDGVSCSACHRLVDPVFDPATSPPLDESILSAIEPLPISPGGGNFILDPSDVRRGPYNDASSSGHVSIGAPFYTTAALCGTCHDVGNPVFLRQDDDTYTLTALDEPHPTADKYDMFPLERTYSEWLHSDFAISGIDMRGRFGGRRRVVSTCQDCHMPITEGRGCSTDGSPVRDDLASHDFAGGNAWVQDMILNLYPDDGINPAALEAGKERARSMLRRASTLDVTQVGNHINVRITNQTGHKLPTGYPEGRRMWINVEVMDKSLSVIEQRGTYDALTAELSTDDTKVYEAELGVDADVSAATGIPEGKSFHFALNNVYLKDNRIPPRGFTNAAYRMVQAQPVGASYLDGQFWDDTQFRLPSSAWAVTVNVYYQTASKEYITFLRDENTTNDAGEVLFTQWELTGKSPPVLMATSTSMLVPFADGDVNRDGRANLSDYAFMFDQCHDGPDIPFSNAACGAFDFDADKDVDVRDFREFQLSFSH